MCVVKMDIRCMGVKEYYGDGDDGEGYVLLLLLL
jgi:hypothetical protein